MSDRVVSIGFLTEGDLKRLGKRFTRHFPVVNDDQFDDLLAQLERVPAIAGYKTENAPTQ